MCWQKRMTICARFCLLVTAALAKAGLEQGRRLTVSRSTTGLTSDCVHLRVDVFSVLLRFTDDTFDEHLQSTIGSPTHKQHMCHTQWAVALTCGFAGAGVDFKLRTVRVNDKTIKLTVWDTAGQERFRALLLTWLRGSVAAAA